MEIRHAADGRVSDVEQIRFRDVHVESPRSVPGIVEDLEGEPSPRHLHTAAQEKSWGPEVRGFLGASEILGPERLQRVLVREDRRFGKEVPGSHVVAEIVRADEIDDSLAPVFDQSRPQSARVLHRRQSVDEKDVAARDDREGPRVVARSAKQEQIRTHRLHLEPCAGRRHRHALPTRP
jgi:hypothetical protein